MNEINELWAINQGKRLVKRLRKVGVQTGGEYDFLFQALKTAAAVVSISESKEAGQEPDQAAFLATVAVNRIKGCPEHKHTGYRLYNLLLENGAVPGRVKAELDRVLFVAGITNDEASMMPSAAEMPSHPGFPSNDPIRENY